MSLQFPCEGGNGQPNLEPTLRAEQFLFAVSKRCCRLKNTLQHQFEIGMLCRVLDERLTDDREQPGVIFFLPLLLSDKL